MEQTLYAVLTDAESRTLEAIEQRLAELNVGAPWFD